MSSLTDQPGRRKVDPATCPLCGRPNACQMAARADTCVDGPPDCWCKTKTFPAALLAQVPADAVNKACICAACQQAAQDQQQ